MSRWMKVTQRPSKKILTVFLLFATAAICWGSTCWANAPVLSDLKVVSITSFGDFWNVELTLDVFHDDQGKGKDPNPIAQVSNLTLRAYDQLGGQVAKYVDHPFSPNTGNSVDNYPVSIKIPKSASGHLVIEACAKHGKNWGCTTWKGCIPQESSYEFSGGLDFLHGTQPTSTGVFESTHWILSIDACGAMTVTLNTLNCGLLCTWPNAEIPTWWRVWDSTNDNDGKLIDTGWITVADFIKMDGTTITIPPGWSGEIAFQLKMNRSGYGNPAGHYSCSLRVEVDDGS